MVQPIRPLSGPRLEEIEPRDEEGPTGYGKDKVGQGRRHETEDGHDLRHSERAGHQDRPDPAIVILAMGAAKKAAHAIDRKLQEEYS
jgi:hypothetical protein